MTNNIIPKISIVDIGAVEISCMLLLCIALIFSIINIFSQTKARSNIYRYLLTALHLVASFAILGLTLQPKYQTNEKQIVRLITNSDFTELENNSGLNYLLLNQSYTDESFKISSPRFADKIIQTPEQLLLKHPALSKLEIIGNGLTPSQWENFPNIEIGYHVPTIQTGIIQPTWESSINLGEALIFTGRFQSSTKDLYSVQLINPAGEIIDTKKVISGEIFTLTDVPKLEGLHKYHLEISKNDQPLDIREDILIEVTETSKAKILVLQSSPSFETKQLQNWAGESGVQLLVRTRISQNKHITRTTNISDNSIKLSKDKTLDSQLMEQFDLVIIDGRELVSMSNRESESLKLNIEKGLGLLVLVDDDLIRSSTNTWPNILAEFHITPLTKETEIVAHIIGNNLKSIPLTDEFIPLSAHSISSQADKTSVNSLVETKRGDVVVASRRHQLGQIAISLLKETHRLVTSANTNSYSKLWQKLIESISRKHQQTEIRLGSYQQIHTENQLINICYRKSSSNSQPLTILRASVQFSSETSHEILLQPDVLNNNQDCGYFWPKTSGWYDIFVKNTSVTKRLYVSPINSWLAHRQQEMIQATQSKQTNYLPSDNQVYYGKAINEWIFWWLFLISAVLIWLERKLR